MSKRLLWCGCVASIVAISGCVTINIYFPAAAAEKTADKIIDEVWQIKKQGESAPAKAPSDTTPATKQ